MNRAVASSWKTGRASVAWIPCAIRLRKERPERERKIELDGVVQAFPERRRQDLQPYYAALGMPRGDRRAARRRLPATLRVGGDCRGHILFHAFLARLDARAMQPDGSRNNSSGLTKDLVG